MVFCTEVVELQKCPALLTVDLLTVLLPGHPRLWGALGLKSLQRAVEPIWRPPWLHVDHLLLEPALIHTSLSCKQKQQLFTHSSLFSHAICFFMPQMYTKFCVGPWKHCSGSKPGPAVVLQFFKWLTALGRKLLDAFCYVTQCKHYANFDCLRSI